MESSSTWCNGETGSQDGAWTRLCVLELKAASLCPMKEEQFSSLGLDPITSSCGCSNEARVCEWRLCGPCNRHRVGLRGEQRRVALPVGPDHPPGLPRSWVRRWRRPPLRSPLCGGWGQPPHWDWTPENQAERAGTPEAQAPRVLHADAVGPVKGKLVPGPRQAASAEEELAAVQG